MAALRESVDSVGVGEGCKRSWRCLATEWCNMFNEIMSMSKFIKVLILKNIDET